MFSSDGVFSCRHVFPAGCRNSGAVKSVGTAGLRASVSISSENFSRLFLQRLEFCFADLLIAFYVSFWRKDFSEFCILLLRPQRLLEELFELVVVVNKLRISFCSKSLPDEDMIETSCRIAFVNGPFRWWEKNHRCRVDFVCPILYRVVDYI